MAVVGSSPEALVKLSGRRAQLRPIAGTRPRGADAAADAAREAELRADPKENAEHVMLVDLARNDLGRVASAGSVAFLFKRMGVFRLHPEKLDADELELELIDHGLEEMGESAGEKGEPQLLLRCAFADFGRLQKALEDRGITPISAESEYVPLRGVELAEEQATDVLKLVDRLEQDEDVQKVFHNLA